MFCPDLDTIRNRNSWLWVVLRTGHPLMAFWGWVLPPGDSVCVSRIHWEPVALGRPGLVGEGSSLLH